MQEPEDAGEPGVAILYQSCSKWVRIMSLNEKSAPSIYESPSALNLSYTRRYYYNACAIKQFPQVYRRALMPMDSPILVQGTFNAQH